MADYTNTGRKIMPNFSVTQNNLIDTVNYLLAGPQTVGQETKGYWNYGGGYLTGNSTPPFITTNGQAYFEGEITGTTLDVTTMYSGNIQVGDYIDDEPLITSSPTVAPYTYITALGTGTGGVGTYTVNQNPTVNPTGTIEMTAHTPYVQPSMGDPLDLYTPAYVNVKTTSATDRVLVTGQFRPFMRVQYTDPASVWNIKINVNRYKLVDANTPYFIDYISYVTIAQDNNVFNSSKPLDITDGENSFGETIFASIVDSPPIGYYAYVLDIVYSYSAGDPFLEWIYGENIGITAAVIKI